MVVIVSVLIIGLLVEGYAEHTVHQYRTSEVGQDTRGVAEKAEVAEDVEMVREKDGGCKNGEDEDRAGS